MIACVSVRFLNLWLGMQAQGKLDQSEIPRKKQFKLSTGQIKKYAYDRHGRKVKPAWQVIIRDAFTIQKLV